MLLKYQPYIFRIKSNSNDNFLFLLLLFSIFLSLREYKWLIIFKFKIDIITAKACFIRFETQDRSLGIYFKNIRTIKKSKYRKLVHRFLREGKHYSIYLRILSLRSG